MAELRERGIGYLRVSTPDQKDNTSPETQQEKILELGNKKSIQVVKFFDGDLGKSGKKLELRDALDKAIEFACNPKNKIKYFLVWRRSRLNRKLRDYLNVREVLLNAGVEIISVMNPDIPKNHFGYMLEVMEATMDEIQGEIIIENCLIGLEKRLKEGYVCGTTPDGYKKPIVIIKYARDMELDPFRAPFIRKMFDMFLSGNYGYSDIAERVNQEGYRTQKNKPLSIQSLQRILRNKTYAGYVYVNGNKLKVDVPGRHEAIVTLDEWHATQRLMDAKIDKKRSSTDINPNFALAKILKCRSCSHTLSGSYPKSRSGERTRGYYSCTRGKRCEAKDSFKQSDAESSFLGLLYSLQITGDVRQIVQDRVVRKYKNKKQQSSELIINYDAQIAETLGRLTKIEEAYESNRYSLEKYDSKVSEIDKRIGELQYLRKLAEKNINDIDLVMSDVLDFLEHLPLYWIGLSTRDKYNVHKLLVGDELRFDGNRLSNLYLIPLYQCIDDTFYDRLHTGADVGVTLEPHKEDIILDSDAEKWIIDFHSVIYELKPLYMKLTNKAEYVEDPDGLQILSGY